MSCLAQESRESKTLSSFLPAMLTHSRLCVLRVRGFRVVSAAWLRRLDNYRRWWRFNCRCGDFIPALCIEVQAILLSCSKPAETKLAPWPPRGLLRGASIRRRMTAVGWTAWR